MPIELVIFDCDGVLVDSERIAVAVNQIVFRQLGWELTVDEIVERFMGRSEADIRAEIEAHVGPVPDDFDAAFHDEYRKRLAAELTAVDGIHEALAQIKLPTCVASSGSHEKMEFTLGKTELWKRFEGRIYSASEVEHGKPAPDLFLHAGKQMGVAPSACVVVEDSRYGVQAARAAGMQSLGYAGGLSKREWLAGPDTTLFDDMRELPGLIEQLG